MPEKIAALIGPVPGDDEFDANAYHQADAVLRDVGYAVLNPVEGGQGDFFEYMNAMAENDRHERFAVGPVDPALLQRLNRDGREVTKIYPESRSVDIRHVYLCGPMTGIPEFNYPAFHAAAERLRADGYQVYSPAEVDGVQVSRAGLTGTEKASDIGFDLRAAFTAYTAYITSTADAVAVLPGWENSPGANAEVALARAIRLPVIDALTGEPVHAAFDVKVCSAEVLACMERHPAGKGRGRRAVDLIGMSGYAQSGKDTVGEILVRDHGFTLVSPSNIIRELLYAQDLYLEGGVDDFGQHQPPARLNDIVDLYGWDTARQMYPEVRLLQQKTGTEAGRNVLHEDVWLDALADRFSPGAKHVSTSVRYRNEARFITERGGVIVRVNRPGVEAINAHPSDTEMDDWDFDYVIENDGSLVDLVEKVAALVAELDA